MGPGDETAYGFSREDAERISRTNRLTEWRYRNEATGARGFAVRQPVTKCAVTGSGGITAMSGTLVGTGMITLSDFDGTNINPRSTTVPCFNNMTSAVAGSINIKVTWVDGAWFVINVDC